MTKQLTQTATATLNALVQGLNVPGDYRRIGGKVGGDSVYMPVCVEWSEPMASP